MNYFWNFIKKRNFEENIQWEELLTKDFIRENAKSRPGFSKNIENIKHQIESFKGEKRVRNNPCGL